MKTLIVLALAVVAVLAVPKAEFREKWVQFKLAHKKVYSNPIEEIRRLAIFQDNVAKIEEHNARYKKGEVTYTKAINQFGDMSKDEFLEYVNRGKLTRPKKNEKLRLKWEPSKVPAAGALDWRSSRAVSEVKNQGQCGSCWSFAATGALEGQLALYSRGGLVSLSEQNLIDCSGGYYGNSGCDGGWMGSAYDYIYDYGIESENAYPYEARDDRNCRFDSSQSVTSISGYIDLPYGDEEALLDAVSNNGPVAVAVDATDELQFYSDGILYDQTCNSEDLNHGVLVVGFGSDGGYDYWLVKNSWGETWGESGYYRTVRNQGNNCGIASGAEVPQL